MSVFRVTQDPETGYGYIYLADDIPPGGVAHSVPLEKDDGSEPDALGNLVLDFGPDGRLIGIEILGRAENTLRPEVLERASHP